MKNLKDDQKYLRRELIYRSSHWLTGSSHSQAFHKIGILKNFAELTGKFPCWRHF